MRLLIHGLNYAPEFVGIGKYTSEMAEWFAGRGHAVRVHCARPYYPEWRVPASYSVQMDSEKRNGVEVRRHAIYVPEKPTGLSRIRHHVSWLTKSRASLIRSAEEFRPDIVLSVAPSLIGTPAALQAARKAKAISVLHVQDFEVGAAAAAGLIKSKVMLSGASWVERALLSRFDFITTISSAMQRRLLSGQNDEGRTAIVRNWADVDAIQVASPKKSEIRRNLGLGPDKTVCLYAGTISNKQGLETVIQAARELSGRSDIVFLIFGEGPTKKQYEAEASGLSNVRFGSFVPLDALGDLLAGADIHLLPQIEGAADLVLPSKLTGMLASGRPVIATTPAGSGLSEELDGCGIVTKPGSAEALARAISELADDPHARSQLGANARRRAEAVWQKHKILETLEKQFITWARRRGVDIGDAADAASAGSQEYRQSRTISSGSVGAR